MQRTDLANHFQEKLFIAEMRATTKEEALGELLDLFVQQKLIRNRDLVWEMLHQRETLGSTGIGKGVAIPHGRTTAASSVFIAFGKSTKGIDFDAIDKKPVHLFFMVIAPPHDEGNIYLPVLGTLVTVLNDKNNRDRLLEVTSFADFVPIITGD